jgi:hypothetical protein
MSKTARWTPAFLALAQKLDQKTTPNLATDLAIAVSIMIAIGGALYYPVREAIGEQEALIEVVRREAIDRDRAGDDARVVKLWDELNRTTRDGSYLQGQLHPLPPRQVSRTIHRTSL